MRRIFSIILTLTTIIYSLIYASFGGFIGNKSAMSKIGLDHHTLFAIWGMLTLITLGYGLVVAYRRTRYKFYIPMLIVASIGMLLTITCDFDYDKHTQYLLHCAGSLTFSVLTGICVFLLFLLCRRYIFTIITAVILIIDLVLLLIYKETAFIELMPIFSGCIMLMIHNLRKEKEKVEIK